MQLNLSPVSEDEKRELEAELFGGVNPYRVFRGLVAHFPMVKNQPSVYFQLRLAMFNFTFNGGIQSEIIDESVTHVICHK